MRRNEGPRRPEPSVGSSHPHNPRNQVSGPPPSTPSAARQHFVAMSGEFVGTVMFLYFAFGATQIANVLNPDGTNTSSLMFIALAFGFSLATTAWVFYRVSGGLFNPAITLGMVVTGSLPAIRGLLLLPCQLLGGIVAAALVKCMFPGPLLVETQLSGGTSSTRGVFIEMFLTIELMLTVLFIAVEKQKATFVAPVAIGLALFVAELTGVYFTGGSLNPARSLGPAVANRHFPRHHWIYWIGPFLGALVAGGYYKFAKYLEYENANPGQDDSDRDVERKQSGSQSGSTGGSRRGMGMV